MIVASSQDLCKLASSPSPVELAQELQAFVKQAAQEGWSMDRVERSVFERVQRIGRESLARFIQGQGTGDLGEKITTSEGQVLQRSSEPATRWLRTVFGEFSFEAYVYAPGSHQKIALRPIDARMQLPEGRATYFFEEMSQYFCIDQAFGQAAEGLKIVFGQKVSVDTLERINRRLGDQAGEFLDQLPVPDAQKEGELLVFTADGKGVPLVKEEKHAIAAFEQKPERPGNRRIAILAGVYSVDRHRRTPADIVAALFRDPERRPHRAGPEPRFKHIRGCFARLYDAESAKPTLVPGSWEALCWANEEVEKRRRKQQPLILLMDGQKSLWETAASCLESVPDNERIEILDIIHVSQYVWRAAKVFHTSFEHREAFTRDRLERILQGQVEGVISGLRQMATKQGLTGARRRAIDIVCGYFASNASRMRYDEYLREGYPIATGVIEGACRHLVKDRMERSGMRWRVQGAQAMLNVRATWQSSYWKEFHEFRAAHQQSTLHRHRKLISNYQPDPIYA